jgi:long-subunit fatty acid transport protein
MKQIFCLILTLSLTVLSTTAAWGTSATGFGARAIGMGGAYTAVADDESAAYWNPAGVTQTKHFRFVLGAGYHGDLEKLQNASEDISDDQMPDRNDLNESYSLLALVGFTSKHLGLNVYSDTQLVTRQDAQNDISATMESYNYGLLTVAGSPGKSNRLSIGVNFKAVYAGYGEVSLPALPDDPTDPNFLTDAAAYTATTAYNTAEGTACDLGLLYQLTSKINLGFIARNLYSQVDEDNGTKTTYKLDYSDTHNLKLAKNSTSDYTHEIKIPKTYVLGVAYRPFKHTLLAADVERITNSSNDQTRLHVGLEQNALWNLLSLRLGYFTYNDGSDDSSASTAGVGFNLWIINCNVAYVDAENPFYMATANIKF